MLSFLFFFFFLILSSLLICSGLLLAQVCARSHKESIQSELLLEVFRSNPSAQRGATCRSQLESDKPVLVEHRQREEG